MKYEVYAPTSVSDDFSTFDFVSYGKKGRIFKRVMFTPSEGVNLYNLAFGDLDEQEEIDDYVVSNNGDRNEVLATVASAVRLYLDMFPDRVVCFEGSTPGRTRLYRMAINVNLNMLSEQFDIYVSDDKSTEPFNNNLTIIVFSVKKKDLKKQTIKKSNSFNL